jgi:hypothetical protein
MPAKTTTSIIARIAAETAAAASGTLECIAIHD